MRAFERGVARLGHLTRGGRSRPDAARARGAGGHRSRSAPVAGRRPPDPPDIRTCTLHLPDDGRADRHPATRTASANRQSVCPRSFACRLAFRDRMLEACDPLGQQIRPAPERSQQRGGGGFSRPATGGARCAAITPSSGRDAAPGAASCWLGARPGHDGDRAQFARQLGHPLVELVLDRRETRLSAINPRCALAAVVTATSVRVDACSVRRRPAPRAGRQRLPFVLDSAFGARGSVRRRRARRGIPGCGGPGRTRQLSDGACRARRHESIGRGCRQRAPSAPTTFFGRLKTVLRVRAGGEGESVS